MRVSLTILSLAFGAALPLAAQQTSVVGVRPLAFGALFPGVPRAVLRTDPANSAQFDLKGHPGGSASLTFLLPAVMTRPAGATLPLVFGGNDAGFSGSPSITSPGGLDPPTPHLATITGNPPPLLLGGTAHPSGQQRSGPQ